MTPTLAPPLSNASRHVPRFALGWLGRCWPGLAGVVVVGALGAAAPVAWARTVDPGQSIDPGAVQAGFQDSPKAIVDQAWQIINQEYVDGKFNQVDWQTVRQDLLGRDYTTREEAYEALRAAIQRLNDPYTRFMDPKQFESLANQTSGELTGIGIRLDVDEQADVLRVLEPIKNSPAEKGGLKSGDAILAIDGQTTRGMSAEKAASLIRGEVGSVVRLTIQRGQDSPFELSLSRARVEVQIVRSLLKQEGDLKVGYIRLNEFSAHAAEQMQAAISSLQTQGVGSYVLDLRGNPGGLLNASIEIARMWLDTGGIVSTTDREGKSQAAKANRTALTHLPLAVLVDGNSASASEILTGALKDNARAVVVGSKTFGKALVQSVHALGDGSGLAVTIAHYYTPAGTDINKTGIEPDVTVDLSEAQQYLLFSDGRSLGSERDPQYQRAISALRTRIAASDNVAPFPSTLPR